jgi:hypothetical protein
MAGKYIDREKKRNEPVNTILQLYDLVQSYSFN